MCVSLCKCACASTVCSAAEWTGGFTHSASSSSYHLNLFKYYQFVMLVSVLPGSCVSFFFSIFLVLYIAQLLMMPMALFCHKSQRQTISYITYKSTSFWQSLQWFHQKTNPIIMSWFFSSVLTVKLSTKVSSMFNNRTSEATLAHDVHIL